MSPVRPVRSVRLRAVACAAVFVVAGGGSLSGCSSYLYSDAIDICQDHVSSGFMNRDTVEFSNVDADSDDGTHVDVSGDVSATGASGGPVSGPWTCTAVESSGGYWTADIDISQSLY